MRVFESGRRAGASMRRPPGTVTLATLLLTQTLLATAGLAAQERARWTDLVYRPGAAAFDSAVLSATVEVYSAPPRWRAEVRPVVGGTSADEPLLLVNGGGEVLVLTQLGAAPLAEHAGAEDPLVRAVVERFDPASGRRVGAASGRVVEMGPNGTAVWIVERLPAIRPEFGDAVFQTGTASRLGRELGRFGIQTVGGERREEVVASAAARGVSRVRTLDGEITVTPDAAGIAALARLDIGVIELERFWRAGGFLSSAEEGVTP